MSYFSNLLTATKSRYQSIRNSDDDGDTEDDSHISRVLRTYYQETSRSFPDWLGPPPNFRTASPSASLSLRSTNRRGGSDASAGSGSLSEIWDGPDARKKQSRPSLFGDDEGERSTSPGVNRKPVPARPRLFGDDAGAAERSATPGAQKIRERLWGRSASPGVGGGLKSPEEERRPAPAGRRYNY